MTLNKNVSRLIKAMDGWKSSLKPFSQVPDGMFGRVAVIESGGVSIKSEELDFEFTVEFDDNMESNEAEITVYNLSKTTIDALKHGNPITITAGYKNDTGVIFSGDIVKVSTKKTGMDKVTTIKAVDFLSGNGDDISDLKEKTYKAGTKASYILKDLLETHCSQPVVEFSIKRDHTYKDEEKVSGLISDLVKRYAEVCGISVYVNNGKIYARHISEGDNINFTVNADTGLIESPEEFEEEITAEDYKDVVTGYNLRMILQYRMTTAVIINLTSVNVSGQYRVRSGKHIFSPDESVTEIEVISC